MSVLDRVLTNDKYRLFLIAISYVLPSSSVNREFVSSQNGDPDRDVRLVSETGWYSPRSVTSYHLSVVALDRSQACDNRETPDATTHPLENSGRRPRGRD